MYCIAIISPSSAIIHIAVQSPLHQTQLRIVRSLHCNHCFINCNHPRCSTQSSLYQTQLIIARVLHCNHCFINCNHPHCSTQLPLHSYASQRIIRALLVNNSNELTHQQQNYDKQQISRSRDVLLCLTAKSRTSRSLVRLPRTRVVSSRASTCSAVMNLSNTTSQHTHHPHHSILLVIYRVLLKK